MRRIVYIAAIVAQACHAPTLWVGTALAPDSGAALGTAGEGLMEEQPAAAGIGGVGGHITEAVGGNVPVQTPAVDAGQQPTAAGHGGSQRDAGIAEAPPAEEEDAGTDDPPEVLTPSKLPTIEGQCPDMSEPGTYMFSGGGRSLMVDIKIAKGAKAMPAPGGPLILYFHSLGGVSAEVTKAFGQPAIDQVIAQGGVVASFTASTCLRCGLADDVVWYDEDDAVSDQVVACSMQQAHIDPRRIHAIGFSSGALHSTHLALARSSYIASVVSYSGGLPAGPLDVQDPANKVPALLSFGREGIDNAFLDFNIASRDWYRMFAPQGYYVLLCNHQRGHEIPTELVPHALRFFADHPYRVNPEPYLKTVPTTYPSFCKNGPPSP